MAKCAFYSMQQSWAVVSQDIVSVITAKNIFILSRVEVLSLVLGFEYRGHIQVSGPRFEFWARIQSSWVWLSIEAYGSLFHLPEGSSCRLYDSIRLRNSSHRPSFLFSSRHPLSWTDLQRVSKILRRLSFTNPGCLCDYWKPSFLPRLDLTGVHIRGALQHGGHVGEQKINWHINIRLQKHVAIFDRELCFIWLFLYFKGIT